ncbi:MFS transporter [Streptomyces sp. Ac-502]|uniref:MFS transporter n=1 Tax=Streptomyces sp. Ac-502 TaxID=3342801 RepID=UPI00386266FA
MTQPAFRRFWAARTLSLVGDYAFRIAFATHLITVTGSASVLAAATAALLVPSLLFYLVGGAVGDRTKARRRVLVVCDVARVVVLLLIAAATYWTTSALLLVALSLLIGIADGFFMPVSFSYMLEITSRDKLVSANSALSVSMQFGLIGGPLIGGLLVGFVGAPATFAFDALTFLFSGILLMVRPKGVTGARPETTGETTGEAGVEPRQPLGEQLRRFGRDIVEALHYVRGVPWLLIFLGVGALVNAVFAGVLDVPIPLIMSPEGTSQAQSLGVFYALEGVGALIGAVILMRLTVKRLGTSMFAMLLMMAAALTAVGFFGGGIPALALALLYGIGLHVFNSLYPSLLQDRVPENLTSRVGSLSFLGFDGLIPLGTLLMGPLVTTMDAQGAAMVAGAAAVLLSLAALLAPSIRGLKAEPPADVPAAEPDLAPADPSARTGPRPNEGEECPAPRSPRTSTPHAGADCTPAPRCRAPAGSTSCSVGCPVSP